MPDPETGLMTPAEIEKAMTDYEHMLMRESGMFYDCPYCGLKFVKENGEHVQAGY